MRNGNFFLVISRDEDVLDLYVELLRTERLPVIGVGTCEEAATVTNLVPCGAALFDVDGRDDWASLARFEYWFLSGFP